MSNNKITLRRKPVKEPLVEIEENVNIINKISNDKIKEYKRLQLSNLESEAYILAKNFSLDLKCAKEAIRLLGYDKAIEFTDLFYKMAERGADYLKSVRKASKNNFSFVPKEILLLEQEVMNFQNRADLDLMQRNYRDFPEDSEHHFEHFIGRMDRYPLD